MYEEIADKIWNYENSLYDPAINNWKDTREQGKVVSSNPIGSVAWCHGAAGVLYSRILCYEFVEDKNGKIDWNWISKELIKNCSSIGKEIVIVCAMVIAGICGF